ncbi:MAG: pentapeptide repeat-containing protein [Pseudomonadota bacterium]
MRNQVFKMKCLLPGFLIMAFALPVGVFISSSIYAAESDTALKNLEKLVKTKSCRGCDLSGLTLNRLDLVGADLEGADLSSAKLSLTNLTRANLKNCNLRGAIFGGTDLSDADLRGADLRGTSLDSSYHQGAQFDGEFIVSRPYADIGESGVEKEVFVADPVKPKQIPETREVKVSKGSDIGKSPTTITAGKVEPDASPAESQDGQKDLQKPGNVILASAPAAKKVTPMQQAEVDLPSLDEKNSANPSASPVPVNKEIKTQAAIESVPKATAEKKEQKAVELKTITKSPVGGKPAAEKEKKMNHQTTAGKAPNAPKVVEEKQKLGKASVGGGNQQTDVDTTKKENLKRLLDKNKCYGCDLSGLDLSGKNLDSADLEKADLTGCNLEKADLEKANLKGALLVKANLRKARLKNADFYKADLAGADLTGAKVKGTMFDNAQTSAAVGLMQAIGHEDK